MGTISAAQYEKFRSQMKQKTGVEIEKYNAGTKNSALQHVENFNKKVAGKVDGDLMAKSFDSVLDLQLQKKLAEVIKKTGARTYADLWKNKKVTDMLKENGIVIQAMDKSWNPCNPKVGNRNWQISMVDKDGNVIKDEKGKLAQFKMKDFGGDGYLRQNELYVNDLLKIAGYDCVSSLELSDAELAEMASLAGVSSDVNVGQTISGTMANIQAKQQSDAMLNQMREKSNYQLNPLTGDVVDKAEAEKDSDKREKVSKARYEQLVENLVEESKDKDGEATITNTRAEEKISEKYVVDDSLFAFALA